MRVNGLALEQGFQSSATKNSFDSIPFADAHHGVPRWSEMHIAK